MATFEDVTNLALRRGLFFPASEIYNGPAGFFDYGPYGLAIKNKVIALWRKQLVKRTGCLEIDGAITVPAGVLQASGHLANFSDPLAQCKKCHSLHRADKILTDATKIEFKEAMSDVDLTKAVREHNVHCPKCKGELMDVRRFNMVVKADIGAAGAVACYMRPETCQTIFIDFKRVYQTMRMKLPQGISQVGKVFRNEISPRQGLLRSVEFSQMETEVFFNPEKINEVEGFAEVENYEIMIQRAGSSEAKPIKAKDLVDQKIVSGKVIAYYLAITQQLYESYGFAKENMRFRELDGEERAFYAREGWDFEVKTSVGWLELIANNYRTDYDLAGHAKGSKQDMDVMDENNKKYIPHVWEISIGVDRTFYAIIENSLRVGQEKTILALPKSISSVEVAIFPLLSNKPDLVKKAEEVYALLKDKCDAFYDESGSIGKRYARMDEVGCPICITIDFDTLTGDDVTVRDRDSGTQKRVKISDLVAEISKC